MDARTHFDTTYCWHVYTFYENNQEVGYMHVAIEDEQCDIYAICSFEKGYGTKMIQFLKQQGISTICGDASPESIGFWNTFNPKWNEDSFTIAFAS